MSFVLRVEKKATQFFPTKSSQTHRNRLPTPLNYLFEVQHAHHQDGKTAANRPKVFQPLDVCFELL